jgi:predicted Ser/Thr protein kinase
MSRVVCETNRHIQSILNFKEIKYGMQEWCIVRKGEIFVIFSVNSFNLYANSRL